MAINLNVPYINQLNQTPPAAFDGSGACGPTSAVMVLAGYNLLDPNPQGFGWYVANQYVNRQGYNFNHTELVWPKYTYKAAGAYGYCITDGEAQANLLAAYVTKHGLNASVVSAGPVAAKAQLQAGKPVILGTNIHHYGHVIVLKGLTDDGRFITNDPIRPEPGGKIYNWSDFNATPYMIVFDRAMGSGPSAAITANIVPDAVPMDYKIVIASDGSRVRSGPSTKFSVITTLKADPDRQYKVTSESHGENVLSNKQPSGLDDTWCYIPELDGYISRAIVQIVGG